MSLALAGFITDHSNCLHAISVIVTPSSKKDTFHVWTKSNANVINRYTGTHDFGAVLQFWIAQTDTSVQNCKYYYSRVKNPDVTASKNGNFLVLKYKEAVYFFKIADYEFLLEDASEKEKRLLVVLHRSTLTSYGANLQKGSKFPNIPVRKHSTQYLTQLIQ